MPPYDLSIAATVTWPNGLQTYHRLYVTARWAEANDNFALISIGLNVPEDISFRQFNSLCQRGRVRDISREERAHAGHPSSCVLRGDAECRW